MENPTNSFIWNLREAQDLAGMSGMKMIEFTNCMFRGGRRNKHTTVLTNVAEIAEALSNKICINKVACTRTGLAHLSSKPEVINGSITKYQAKG